MSTILITGANRGIGLALTKEYLSRGDEVIATARNPGEADELAATGAEVHALDVSDGASIDALATALEGRPIDLLINNAGVGSRGGFGDLDFDAFERVLAVNTIAPIRVTQALTANLEAGVDKQVAMITSQLGSIENTDAGWGLIYRTSKAGLNMAARAAARTLADKDITVVALHPGHVETDMGGKGAPVSPLESARGLADTIASAGRASQLRFFNYKGETLPW